MALRPLFFEIFLRHLQTRRIAGNVRTSRERIARGEGMLFMLWGVRLIFRLSAPLL